MQGKEVQKLENYKAVMLLAAIGDAMGYRNGSWEFNYSSTIIHKEMMELTNNKGPLHLKIGMDWKYSDDTVMHIATAVALVNSKITDPWEKISQNIALQYKKCGTKMSGRAPGRTCMKSIQILDNEASNWNKIPYSDRRGGCGASMRSACIGLFFQKDVKKLVAVSIESGRITHHSSVGYLGALVSSYFTYSAIQRIPPKKWMAYFFEEALPIAKKHIENCKREVKLNLEDGQWDKFIKAVISYCKERKVSIQLQVQSDPYFPQKYDFIQRQHFYKEIAWTGWPGALGIDSVLIAYDAFLGCKGSWEQFCLRGILHGGDNDSTGTIGGAWFGAYYGLKGVPQNHFKEVEDCKKLIYLAEKLFYQSK